MTTPPKRRTPTAWIKPTDTDPTLLVDREEERGDLLYDIKDCIESGVYDRRLLISGVRGIGKSIVARWVLKEVKREFANDVVTVMLEGRTLRARTLLERFGARLAQAARECFNPGHDIQPWLSELDILATHSQITRGEVESLARSYGVTAGAEANWLLAKLKSSFAWEERRSAGQTTSAVATVTDAALHQAITKTLQRIRDEQRFVVVLFDDLDQTASADDPLQAREFVRRVLDLAPCIGLAHLRTESLSDDVKREIDRNFPITGLSADLMVQMLDRRLAALPRPNADLFKAVESNRTHLIKLAEVTENALVFLRWASALLATHGLPLPSDWASPSQLERAANLHTQAVSPALLTKLLSSVDHCALAPERVWCRREDLARGGSSFDPKPALALSEAELAMLIDTAELLLPRNRFESPPHYRVEPVTDLLRPSVRARLG